MSYHIATPFPMRPRGVGLFDNGFDPSTWGIGEWAIVGLGAYLFVKLTQDVKKTSRKVRRYSKSRAKKSARRESLLKELRSL